MAIKKSRKTQKVKVVQLSALACAMFVAGSITAQDAGGELFSDKIMIENTPSVASFIGSNARQGGSLKVRISGPDGTMMLEQRSLDGVIEWVLPAGLKDGQYYFDAWFTPTEAQGLDDAVRGELLKDGPLPEELRTQYNSGFLKIKDGLIEAIPSLTGDEQASVEKTGWLNRAIGGLGDFFVPAAHAQDVTASASSPDFILNDTDRAGTEWEMGMDVSNDTDLEFDGNSGQQVGTFAGDAPANSLFIENTGDIGLGTATPGETLHIVDANTPGIRLDDAGTGDWTIQENSDDLRFTYNETGGGTFFQINSDGNVQGFGFDGTITAPAGQADTFFYNADSGTSNPDRMFWAHSPGFARWGIEYADAGDFMYFQQNSTTGRFVTFDFNSRDVGIGGGFNPEEVLHVQRSTDAKLLVENTTGTQGQRNLFELRNAGKTRFVIENTGAGIWTFDNAGATFDISRAGTGIAEFQVFTNGNARLQNGDMLAQGFTVISSREAKTDFAAVDSASMLDKVSQLEISEWQYKADEAAKRHIGPVAEDFAEIFGIGNGKTISVSDTAGIAFAAIKGLREEVRSRDDQIAELRSELDELRRLIQDAND